jgi:hypothetical protein
MAGMNPPITRSDDPLDQIGPTITFHTPKDPGFKDLLDDVSKIHPEGLDTSTGRGISIDQVTGDVNMSEEKLIETIFNQLDCVEPHTKRFIKTILKNIQLFDRKQHDYGPMNIDKFGWEGVMIRLSDKLERMINLWNKGAIDDAACESLTDTWQDICNYGAIGEMCQSGLWKEWKNDQQ